MNFKLTKGKTILTIGIVILLFLLQGLINTFFPTFDAPQKFGLPFTFWEIGCSGMTPQGVTAECVNNFSYTFLIGDLLFWIVISYVISCFIIHFISKKK